MKAKTSTPPSQNRSSKISAAAISASCKNLDDLVLVGSRLKFTSEQLANLNFLLNERLVVANDHPSTTDDNNLSVARSVCERFIQRLVCGVGVIDASFSSKYLVHLHDNNDVSSTKLKYLIRLDKLSTPLLYGDDDRPHYDLIENDPDCPVGYARIRLRSGFYRQWGEYANAHGYLRRDKIQAKYVALLAQSASAASASAATHSSSLVVDDPCDVDETYLCASPGKVVDACTLHHILTMPTHRHCYFGAHGKSMRFPDPRDFRLAIVDEPNGIRLRIEFLSPAIAPTTTSIDVRLLIGIECAQWPHSTDFPSRVPLGHADALLYHRAALTGFYMVGYGVQSSAWQMRFPSAEHTIIENYTKDSSIQQILAVATSLIDEIYQESVKHQKYQFSYRILNSYIFKSSLLHLLEKDFTNPTKVLINWSPLMLSTHLLKILDNLIIHLQVQKQPSYFFAQSNLLANPGHLCEDDYLYESKQLIALLVKLYNQSITSTAHNVRFEQHQANVDVECNLLYRWKELVDGLLPPASTRARRFCLAATSRRNIAYSQYTARQIDYLATLMKAVLDVKKSLIKNFDDSWEDSNEPTSPMQSYTSDLAVILELVFEQAKRHYARTHRYSRRKKKRFVSFTTSTQQFVELVQRNNNHHITDHLDLVKTVLQWLYRALDQNRRLFAPILRPYLTILFVTSHANSWFNEAIDKRMENDELHAFGMFVDLVHDGRLTPADGLADSVRKNWIWAREMLEVIEQHGDDVRLIFIGEDRRLVSHLVAVPSCSNKLRLDIDDIVAEVSTLPKNSYFRSLIKNKEKLMKKNTNHDILRDFSPLTRLLRHVHRQGTHRCCGDIIQTLIAMQKLNVVQDSIANFAPNDTRTQLLDAIQQFDGGSSSSRKKMTMRRQQQQQLRSHTLPNIETYQRFDVDDAAVATTSSQ